MVIHQLESLGVVSISGQDSSKLLQGQITINPDNISERLFSLSALCNPQGRCIALFWITKQNEDFMLVMPKDNIENFLSHLKKYAVFYKVNLECLSRRVFGLLDGDIENDVFPLIRPITEQDNPPIVSISIMAESESLDSINHGNQIKPENDWFAELARLKIVWLSGEASGEFLPHNINLPELKAIDFKKGCFTGQEVIARMQYKGRLKSHLQLLVADHPVTASPKDKVIAGEKRVGEIVCSVTDQQQKTYLLTVFKDNYLNEKNFRLSDENGPILNLSENNENSA